MMPIKTTASLFVLALCLGACASDKGVVVQPKSAANNVVLIDPTTDDSMLPAIGESLSKGAVTIYTLGGPGAPVTVTSQNRQILTPSAASAMPRGGAGPVTLTPPSGMGGGDDPRVTIFDVDGAPVSPRPEPDILTPMPVLQPPIAADPTPMKSPFNDRGEVVAKPADLVPPMSANGKVMGTGARAVSVDNLLDTPPDMSPKAKTTRPPKGMMY